MKVPYAGSKDREPHCAGRALKLGRALWLRFRRIPFSTMPDVEPACGTGPWYGDKPPGMGGYSEDLNYPRDSEPRYSRAPGQERGISQRAPHYEKPKDDFLEVDFETMYRPMAVLTLEAARTVLAAAEAKAKAEGWPCVVSVIDSDGLPILLERMDDAAVLAGAEIAPGKARTAAPFRRPSGALEDAINAHRPAAATAPGFVMMRGGVPITVGGEIVGAIGVSADTPDHDEQIAKAGVAALAQ